MKSNIQKTYTTRLEAISERDSVKAIIDAKLEATSPAQTVDYIALAIDHIDAKVSEINAAIKSLQELKSNEEARKEIIKEQACEWLEDNGIDSLDGLIVSSITINKTKAKETVIIMDDEAIINGGYFKTSVDTTKVKEALLTGVDVEGAKIEVTHVADKIKINKRRVKHVEEV